MSAHHPFVFFLFLVFYCIVTKGMEPERKCLVRKKNGYGKRELESMPNFKIDLSQKVIRYIEKSICVTTYKKSAFRPSFMLFAFRYQSLIIAVDLYGKIVAGITLPEGRKAESPKWVNSTHVIFNTRCDDCTVQTFRNFPSLWNVLTGEVVSVEYNMTKGQLHHDVEYSPQKQTILGISRWLRRQEGAIDNLVLYDDIVEFDLKGNIVWEWNGAKEAPFDPKAWDPWLHQPAADCHSFDVRANCKDIHHGNTLFWDREDDPEGVIYWNAKHTDSFWKINKTTGQTVWAVGRFGNFTLKDINGNTRDHIFLKAHGVEHLGNNTFILFDNLYDREPKQKGLLPSRWVKIEVDEQAKVAREVAFGIFPQRWSMNMGDADPLPNGNIFASITHSHSLLEVTPTGEIKYELTFPSKPAKKTMKWLIFHAERFMVAPMMQLRAGEGYAQQKCKQGEDYCVRVLASNSTKDVVVNFDVFNTVRTRYLVNGTFVARSGGWNATQEFQFRVNWRPKHLEVKVNLPGCGKETNVQFELANQDGRKSVRDIRFWEECKS